MRCLIDDHGAIERARDCLANAQVGRRLALRIHDEYAHPANRRKNHPHGWNRARLYVERRIEIERRTDFSRTKLVEHRRAVGDEIDPQLFDRWGTAEIRGVRLQQQMIASHPFHHAIRARSDRVRIVIDPIDARILR